ncbi:MAG: hypothetical protein WC546_04475 [Candidatus Omnitrophota bacterium]
MKLIKIILILGIVLSPFAASAQEGNDPFESLLPKTEAQPGTTEQPGKVSTPPPITVEGALWDTNTPQAIIDGEVYKVGDTLKNVDGKVYKIEKNVVSIFYEGRLYDLKVAERAEKKEAK